jgi:hypothetical protein
MPTHKVIDLVYREIVFWGSENECIKYARKQIGYGFTVKPLTPEEIERILAIE